MGFLRRFFRKKEEKKEKVEEEGDPSRICALCNQPGAQISFGGVYWHKKCLRKARKMAKGMI